MLETNSQQEKIRRVLAVCKDCWRSNGMSEDQVEMLGEEVEYGLSYAVRNGRTVEDIIGPDLREFADSWAKYAPPADSPKDQLMVSIIVLALILFVTVSLAVRFVPLLQSWWPWYVAVALSLVVAAILLFWPGRSR